MRLLPNIQWEVMYKLDYFSTYPAVYFFAMFLKELFEKDFSIYIIRTVQIFVVLISIIVLFGNSLLYSTLNPYFEIFIITSFIFAGYLQEKRRGKLAINRNCGCIFGDSE